MGHILSPELLLPGQHQKIILTALGIPKKQVLANGRILAQQPVCLGAVLHGAGRVMIHPPEVDAQLLQQVIYANLSCLTVGLILGRPCSSCIFIGIAPYFVTK